MHPKYTPSSPRKPSLDPSTLVEQLNNLLTSLNVPIPLISPTDLTPGLLIAILESILGMRIPLIERTGSVSPELNHSRTAHASTSNSAPSSASRAAKVQNMKVFLGVLETDIIKRDVGLSELDPRRLADGEWDEVLFVAELLCWIGRRMGYIPKAKSRNGEHSRMDESAYIPRRRRTDSTATPKAEPRTPSPTRRKASQRHPPMPLSPKSQLDLDAESLFHPSSSATGTIPHSTTTTTTTTNGRHPGSQRTLSPFLHPSSREESVTSVHDPNASFLHNPNNPANNYDTEDDEVLSSVSDVLGNLSPLKQLNRRAAQPQVHVHPQPQCIHEVELELPMTSLLFSQDTSQVGPTSPTSPESPSPRRPRSRRNPSPESFMLQDDLSFHSNQSPNTSVRFTGYIEPVDEDEEVASFELSRSISSTASALASASRPRDNAKKRRSRAEAVKNQYSRTLELLNERARLLTQLAELKNSHG
ncbi:hypothetical protein NLJ89_g8114 [Agrocybe chaxingu]|uniref:DUF5745 domain-containing protein n=1 Tax=Agrocybe chaxingu TaxID=84603 RepID=A0A9W8JVU8_9AGAR|nr:hypothetical protein NLJ89_g8114 [Agrocybe chaxingu]